MFKRLESILVSSLRVGVAAALLCAPAFAEDAAPAPASTPADSDEAPTLLDDIEVTASKRKESSRAVPAGITALGGEQLEAIGATELEDYFSYVPGLTIDKGGRAGGNQVNLRGISTGPDNTATVGMYVDDAPVGSSTAYAGGARIVDFLATDLDRLEVLRGPQGTLYGASTLGGLVKFVTRDPELGSFNTLAATDLSMTERGDFNRLARGMVNIPLGNAWATRISASHTGDAGYIDSYRLGRADTDSSKNGSVRVLTRGTIGDLGVRLSAMSMETDADGFQAADHDYNTRQPAPGDLYRGNRFEEPSFDKLQMVNATFDWALPVGDFKSVTSYQDLSRDSKVDATDVFGLTIQLVLGAAIPPAVYFGFDTRKWTQEFRLASTGDSALRWTAGLFATDEESNITARITDNSAADGSFLGSGMRLYDALLPTTYREYAAFGDVGYNFTEAFDVTVGGRWARNEQDFRQLSSGLFDTGFPPRPTSRPPRRRASSPGW